MNLRRRQFLKLLGLSAATVALGPIAATWIDEDLYVNRRLGLRLRKPQGWQFLSLRQMQDLQSDQQLACYDEELEQELKEAIGLPLVSMRQPPQPSVELSPMIHVWTEPIDHTAPPPVEAHRTSYASFYARLLSDYLVEQPPTPTVFLGYDASLCIIRFTLETKSGVVAPVRLKSLLFPRGRVGYTLNMADIENGWGPETTAAFESFLSAVEFVSPPES